MLLLAEFHLSGTTVATTTTTTLEQSQQATMGSKVVAGECRSTGIEGAVRVSHPNVG